MIPESPNRLLASLSGSDYRKVLPKLRSTYVRSGDEYEHCGRTRVYFPGNGLCSMRAVMRDGRFIEIAAVGREGVVGYSAAESASPETAYVHIADADVQYMVIDDFHRIVEQNDALQTAVHRHSQTLLHDVIQASACFRSHSVDERCARWILMAREKIGLDRFVVLRKSIAGALGINLKRLSVVLAEFVRARAIEWEGDTLTVIDARKLEDRACYCLERIKRASAPKRFPDRVSTSGNVVRLVPDQVCERCELSNGLPHVSEHDCMTALDRELRGIHIRHIEMTRKRHEILQQRLKVLNAFIRRVKKNSGDPAEELRKLR